MDVDDLSVFIFACHQRRPVAEVRNASVFVQRDSRRLQAVMRPGVRALTSSVSHSYYHNKNRLSQDIKTRKGKSVSQVFAKRFAMQWRKTVRRNGGAMASGAVALVNFKTVLRKFFAGAAHQLVA